MINATLTVDQAKQFMAITESAHMDWEPFTVLQAQIGEQLKEILAAQAAAAAAEAEVAAEEVAESAPVEDTPVEEAEPVDAAAEAAFMDGESHEQFTHEDDKVE
jgi:hypothetical protein